MIRNINTITNTHSNNNDILGLGSFDVEKKYSQIKCTETNFSGRVFSRSGTHKDEKIDLLYIT